MTTEEKFHAAVNVIRSLPKNGTYKILLLPNYKCYIYYKRYDNEATKKITDYNILKFNLPYFNHINIDQYWTLVFSSKTKFSFIHYIFILCCLYLNSVES